MSNEVNIDSGNGFNWSAIPSAVIVGDTKESEWIDIDYSIFGSVYARCKRCTRVKTVKGKDTGWGYEYKLPMYCENCGAEMKNGGVLE